jgi:cell division protease FtsH
LEYANPLVKVTIVPRGQSLGAAWYLPEERSITTTEQLLDEMCSALGGRAAEELVFSKISTGALSDLEKVTKQAYAMISIYGLNKRVGNVSFYDSQGRDAFTKPYSDETAKIIDEEVSLLIESQYQRALKILTENKDKLEQLAEKLLVDEVIFKENLEEVFGKRQWEPAESVEESQPTVETPEASAPTPEVPNTDGAPINSTEEPSGESESTTVEAPSDQ